MQQKLLFILSKGFEKSGVATRAVQFAAMAAENGATVDLFLIDDAIVWAQVGMAEDVRSSTGEHLRELLERLVATKNCIHVCKACAERRFLSPDELMEGSKISTSKELVAMMTSPDYKVITF